MRVCSQCGKKLDNEGTAIPTHIINLSCSLSTIDCGIIRAVRNDPPFYTHG
jgi:hypothetical protein